MKLCYIIFLIIVYLLFLLYFIHSKLYDLIFSHNEEYSLSTIDLVSLSNVHLQKNKIKLYYININKSIERNDRFLSRINKFDNYNVIRISAITPNDFSNYNIQSSKLCSFILKPTEFACTLSHLKTIEIAYNNNDDYALIAEDDLIIDKNINWDYFISILPNNWDIIQLYSQPSISFNLFFKQKIFKNNWLIKTNNFIPSTVFYLISKSGMNKLLTKFVNKNNITLQYHNKICVADNIIYNNLNRYVFTLPYFMPEDLDSTISNFNLWFRNLGKKNEFII